MLGNSPIDESPNIHTSKEKNKISRLILIRKLFSAHENHRLYGSVIFNTLCIINFHQRFISPVYKVRMSNVTRLNMWN